ncbi:hypothetical protein QUF74_04260 [Candidatus Halobeggiatoa sp. HSG11]|nr:hypothetical protein [Candidatus Halobeggiatoa sp. HSG11]
MQINTELDTQHYEKLQQLQRIMGKNLRTLLELAIDDLYARHNVSVGHDALTILQKNNFIGCLHGDGKLSQNYKQELDWSGKL